MKCWQVICDFRVEFQASLEMGIIWQERQVIYSETCIKRTMLGPPQVSA